MSATAQSTSSLPQGFSIFQPTLGAPLQFFPALGSQELDDMINAFIPGPLSVGEKRASVTMDFFQHAQITGQTFKFYVVQSAPSSTASPLTASPSVDSTNSSYNVSPLTPSWDWKACSIPSGNSSSGVSSQRRRESMTSRPSSKHHKTIDISHLPGMKILTKDGLDVTNIASRGSKSKAQRDHAHLMRIIKACDTCRRKKVRCDPSHKKRGAAQAAVQSTSKSTKTAVTVASREPPSFPSPISTTNPEVPFPLSPSLELDSTFSLAGLEDFDPTALAYDPFDDFVQFPAMDTLDFDFLLDTKDYALPQSPSSPSAAASPLKLATPSSQPEPSAPAGAELAIYDLQARSSKLPFLEEHSGSSIDYTDFNLYSPSSSFSEDERMLSVSSTDRGLANLSEPLLSEYLPPSDSAVTNETIEWNDPGMLIDVLQFDLGNDTISGCRRNGGGNGQLTATSVSVGEPRNESYSDLDATSLFGSVSQLATCCGSDAGIIPEDHSLGSPALSDAPVSLDFSALRADVLVAGAPLAAGSSNMLPAELVDQPHSAAADWRGSASTVSVECDAGLEKESPAEDRQFAPATTDRSHIDMPLRVDQNFVAAGPDSTCSKSHILSACGKSCSCAKSLSKSQSAHAQALRPWTVSRPTGLNSNDSFLSSLPDQNHTVGFNRPTSEALCGVSDGARGVASSSLEDDNDKRFQLPGATGSRHVRASSSPSKGSLVLDQRSVDVPMGVESLASSSRAAGTNIDLHEGSCDDDTSTRTGRPNASRTLAPYDATTHTLDSVASGNKSSPARLALFKANPASVQTVIQIGNLFAAMSSVALRVLTGAVGAAMTSVETKPMPTNMKRGQLLHKCCRELSRRSRLCQQAPTAMVSAPRVV